MLFLSFLVMILKLGPSVSYIFPIGIWWMMRGWRDVIYYGWLPMIFWLIASVMMADYESSFRNDFEVGRAALIPRGMDILGDYVWGPRPWSLFRLILFGWLPAFVWKKGGQAMPFWFLPNPSGASRDLCNQSALDAYLLCKKLKRW